MWLGILITVYFQRSHQDFKLLGMCISRQRIEQLQWEVLSVLFLSFFCFP